MIVTFYSFKGGVGRSMALANVAEIIANLGYDVLAIDWDLEAPGLERYFAPSRAVAEDWTARAGLIDLLNEYKQGLRTGTDVARPEPAKSPVEDASGLEIIASGLKTAPEAADYKMLASMSVRRPASFANETPAAIDRKGRVRLLTAGKRYGAARSNYIRTIQGFDWQEFYSDWAGASYFEFFRRDLLDDYHGRKPDVVLIDSRTGVTEQGGVCTHHLADLVVLLTAANDLNLDGTEWMAKQLSRPELVKMRGDRPLHVLPVATRIEQTAQTRELAQFQRAMVDRFSGYLPPPLRAPQRFFTDTEIPYIPYYSFEERVAARESETERSRLLYRAYEALAVNLLDWGTAHQALKTGASAVRSEQPPSATPAGEDVEAVRRAENARAAEVLRVAWSGYSAVADEERAQARNARWRELASWVALAMAAALVCLPISPVVPLRIGLSSATVEFLIMLSALLFGAFGVLRWRPAADSGRSVAGAVKSECYRYAAQIPPYEGEFAPQVLLEFLHGAIKQSRLVVRTSKTRLSAPSMPLGRAEYVAQRIDEQRRWLRHRAARLIRLEAYWNIAIAGSFMIAVLGPVARRWLWADLDFQLDYLHWGNGLRSLFLILSFLMLVYVRQQRSRDRARSHVATAARLDMLSAKGSVSEATPGDFIKLVNDVESMLAPASIENVVDGRISH